MKFYKKTALIMSLACSFAFYSTTVTSQNMNDRISFGLIGGMHSTSANYSNLDSRYFDDPKNVAGFSLGVFAEIELDNARTFSLRPEITYLSRGFKIEDIKNIPSKVSGQLDYNLKANYLDFRLPVIYNFGKPGSVRPYVFVSPVIGFVNGGKISAEDESSCYEIDVTRANMSSLYFAIAPGVGVKFPVGAITLGVEASYEIGIADTYGSKEKDGVATASLFWPDYNIQGNRKFTGMELMAHVSIPLSFFTAEKKGKKVNANRSTPKRSSYKNNGNTDRYDNRNNNKYNNDNTNKNSNSNTNKNDNGNVNKNGNNNVNINTQESFKNSIKKKTIQKK